MNAPLLQICQPDTATATDRRAALRQVLPRLDPAYQTIIALKFFQYYSTAEIAGILHCSAGRVQVLQHHALVEVQRLLTR